MELKISDLAFSYEDKLVLKDVGLTVEQGEILSIIGPNGSGKSTLIKCINRILQPQTGKLILQQQNIKNFTPRELACYLGYVPQHEDRKFPATVFDVVLLGRKPYIDWKPKEEDLKMVSDIISRLDLEPLAMRDVNKLSGGQLQKVIIGRALAQDPEIILLDEPTSSLDLKHQLEVLELIKTETSRGISAVKAIHDLSLAARFSDKFVMLKEGRVYAAGGPEILTPANIEDVYGVKVSIINHQGQTVVVPQTTSA